MRGVQLLRVVAARFGRRDGEGEAAPLAVVLATVKHRKVARKVLPPAGRAVTSGGCEGARIASISSPQHTQPLTHSSFI
jgi:hypothetical protein